MGDAEKMDSMKVYKTERPVNSASISPVYEHVVLGGGQEAMDVTTTSTKIGKFDQDFSTWCMKMKNLPDSKDILDPLIVYSSTPMVKVTQAEEKMVTSELIHLIKLIMIS